MQKILIPNEYEGKIAGKICDLLNNGYSIFTDIFSDGNEYHISKRTGERTTTTYCYISPMVKNLLVKIGAKMGEETRYFGKRQVLVSGMNVVTFVKQ